MKRGDKKDKGTQELEEDDVEGEDEMGKKERRQTLSGSEVLM